MFADEACAGPGASRRRSILTAEISRIARSLSIELCSPAVIRSVAPHEPGIYSCWDAAGCPANITGPANTESVELELLYVGISSDLRERAW